MTRANLHFHCLDAIVYIIDYLSSLHRNLRILMEVNIIISRCDKLKNLYFDVLKEPRRLALRTCMSRGLKSRYVLGKA